MGNAIEIEISDVVIGTTVLKRKAELHTMIYNQHNKSLVLNWKVRYFSDASGEYGEEINEQGIHTYNKESIADNTVMVNATTGEFVERDLEGNYPEGSIGQYDFFYYLAENSEINVHSLIRSYGAAVNW